MATNKLGPAFRLVRDLLSEQPRTFQSLLSASLSQGTSSSTAETSTGAATSRKGKARDVTGGKETRVPEGHPFVSASFLKNRVLPVLESQHLIHLAPAKSSTGGSTTSSFKWALGPPRSIAARSPAEGLPKWDAESHWARLLEGEHPGKTASEYTIHRAMEAGLRREAAIKEGRVRLDETEMRTWGGRKEGLTVRAERGHLNVRRERARGRKERERIALVEGAAAGAQ